MQASFWVQKWTRRITVSDQSAVGVMVEVEERDDVIDPPQADGAPISLPGKKWPIICLGKGEARALASAIMGAAAEL